MKALELHDQDEDQLVVSDFNEDTRRREALDDGAVFGDARTAPESACGPSPQTEAKLTVHQHTMMENPATDLSDVAEEGMSVLLTPDSAGELIAWLTQFFCDDLVVVSFNAEEARALRADLKGHTVADVTEQLKLLEKVAERLLEAVA